MSVFLVSDHRFEPVALREDEFEGVVDQFWDRLAPEWFYFRWKPLLESPEGGVRPDGVAIRRDYSDWSIVEVELASHPAIHFHSQFSRLSKAEYGAHLASGLTGLSDDLDGAEVSQMLRIKPALLCIADDGTESIVRECREFGFQLITMRPYRSDRGTYAADVGQLPSGYRRESKARPFVCQVGEGSWGGNRLVTLPRHFPVADQVFVRTESGWRSCRVLGMGASRRLFLPGDEVGAALGPTLKLYAVDPAQLRFEVGHDRGGTHDR